MNGEVLADNSLTLDPSIKDKLNTPEDFEAYFYQVVEEGNSVSWRKADIFLSYLQKFGDSSLKDFSLRVKHPYPTVISYIRVARAFPPDKRIPNLSFTHHLQAAYVDKYNEKDQTFLGEDRFDWIEKAADEGLSSSNLAAQLHKSKESRELNVVEVPCYRCGQSNDFEPVRSYVLYTPGFKKEASHLELHETCAQEVLTYAQDNRLEKP